MGWWNRTKEEERLMKGPLSGYAPIFPWNQDANIRYNRAREEEAKRQALIASNPMLRLRLEAEAEQRAREAEANYQPIATEAYGPYDGWGQPAGYKHTYSDDDQVAMNKAHDEALATKQYTEDYGVQYSGGATQAPRPAPLAVVHEGSDAKAAGVVPQDATVFDTSKSFYNPETGQVHVVY